MVIKINKIMNLIRKDNLTITVFYRMTLSKRKALLKEGRKIRSTGY
jgi:hypothetical protein